MADDPDRLQFTNERRRALVRKSLLAAPHEPRFLQARHELLAPPAIREAARHGVLVLTTSDDEEAAVSIALALSASGLRAWVECITSDTSSDTSLMDAGVVVLLICMAATRYVAVQHRYGLAMTLGKVIVPLLVSPFPPDKMTFEMAMLPWYTQPTATLAQLTDMLVIRNVPSSL